MPPLSTASSSEMFLYFTLFIFLERRSSRSTRSTRQESNQYNRPGAGRGESCFRRVSHLSCCFGVCVSFGLSLTLIILSPFLSFSFVQFIVLKVSFNHNNVYLPKIHWHEGILSELLLVVWSSETSNKERADVSVWVNKSAALFPLSLIKTFAALVYTLWRFHTSHISTAS